MASPSPTASTTASPSPSATPTASASASSDIPAAARERSEKGAEAFVRYFFEQVNVAWQGPQPGLVQSLSQANCEFCTEVEETSVALSRDRSRYAQRAVSVSNFEPQTGAPNGQVFFQVVLTQHAAQVVDEDGTVVRTDKAGLGDSLVGVKWTRQGWRVVGVEVA